MLQQQIQFLYPQYFKLIVQPTKKIESDSILPIRNYLFSTCDEGLGTINGVQDPNLGSAKQGRRKQSVILCAYNFLQICDLPSTKAWNRESLGIVEEQAEIVVCL